MPASQMGYHAQFGRFQAVSAYIAAPKQIWEQWDLPPSEQQTMYIEQHSILRATFQDSLGKLIQEC